MNIAVWLERAAQLWPDRPALLHGEKVVADYSAFAEQAACLAAHLKVKCGFAAGQRAAVFCKNSPDYLVILYAIWFAGGIVVPINAKLHPKEAAWIIADAEATILFADDGKAEELQSACRDEGHNVDLISSIGNDDRPILSAEARRPEDTAWLFYTSGTTGRPKGVMITHGMLQIMALTYFVDVDEVRHEDVALYAAPMSHGAGLYNFIHVLRGARHVVPISSGFLPSEISALALKLGSIHMFAAPTMVNRLLAYGRNAGWHGDGIRTIVYGGGPMYLADIKSAIDWFGPRFVQIYGQGECPMAISALSRAILADHEASHWEKRAGSVGRPQSCVEVAIMNESGEAMPVGEIGEVVVRGPAVMPGYWRNCEASRGAIREGWLWTGDMGSFDDGGFLTLSDRSKDIIISGGTNIYPREVEEVLLAHPSVREVSVIGEPDADWGEAVVAFVVGIGDDKPIAEDLDVHCQEAIARFKRPKRYIFITGMPKNAYGKVQKTLLRDMLVDLRTGA